MKAAETFLKNRGWVVGSGKTLPEALAYLIQKQPQYLMIAADHPNKKVKILPRILAQAFPVRVIAYAEISSQSSLAAINEMLLPYYLYPPVSGPSIVRLVARIKRDAETSEKEYEEKIRKAQENGNTDELIRLKGQRPGATSVDGKDGEQARAALNQLIMSSGDESSQGTFVSKGDAARAAGAAIQSSLQGNFGGYMPPSPTDEPRGNFIPSSARAPVPGQLIVPPAAGQKKQNNPLFDSDMQEGESFAEWEERLLKQKNWQPGSTSQSAGGPSYTPDAKLNQASESLVDRGTQAALEEAMRNRSMPLPAKSQPIESSSECACLIIESAKFSGYLVAAYGKNRKIDARFMETLKERLFSFLRENGEEPAEQDSMGIKIQEVPFESWAIAHAEFLRKSIHEGDEIAMAFFPTLQTTIKLEESASAKMLQVDITELKEDTIVEFDLYVYMPENNRYLLYTQKGRPLYGLQRNRLVEKGVSRLHLRKESAADVKKYRAQNFLNEKIETYKKSISARKELPKS